MHGIKSKYGLLLLKAKEDKRDEDPIVIEINRDTIFNAGLLHETILFDYDYENPDKRDNLVEKAVRDINKQILKGIFENNNDDLDTVQSLRDKPHAATHKVLRENTKRQVESKPGYVFGHLGQICKKSEYLKNRLYQQLDHCLMIGNYHKNNKTSQERYQKQVARQEMIDQEEKHAFETKRLTRPTTRNKSQTFKIEQKTFDVFCNTNRPEYPFDELVTIVFSPKVTFKQESEYHIEKYSKFLRTHPIGYSGSTSDVFFIVMSVF